MNASQAVLPKGGRSRAPGSVEPPAQEFRTFWTGPPLSIYEILCLHSLTTRGQRVLLYTYDKTLQVPAGVELVDANEILPGDHIHEFVHPNGETSPTLHANLFRYEALRRFGGWYCDLDILLVGDNPPSSELYLAREDERIVNNAVMRFPPNAPLMVAAAAAAKGLMTSTTWGASGPGLLTRLLDEQGLAHLARPWTAAYPIHFTEVAWLFLPERREELEGRVEGADFVHLWNQVWRRARIPKEYGPPEGSFLDALFRKFEVRVAPGARLSASAVASWFRELNIIEDAKRQHGGIASIADLTRLLQQARSEAVDSSRMAELDAALRHVRWERDELLNSTSWRVTAPLRMISRALRRLRHRA